MLKPVEDHSPAYEVGKSLQYSGSKTYSQTVVVGRTAGAVAGQTFSYSSAQNCEVVQCQRIGLSTPKTSPVNSDAL